MLYMYKKRRKNKNEAYKYAHRTMVQPIKMSNERAKKINETKNINQRKKLQKKNKEKKK